VCANDFVLFLLCHVDVLCHFFIFIYFVFEYCHCSLLLCLPFLVRKVILFYFILFYFIVVWCSHHVPMFFYFYCVVFVSCAKFF